MVTEEAAHIWILRRKKENPHVHISYHSNYPKIAMMNEPAVISGVYAHLFELEYMLDGRRQVKAHTYADLICKRLEIAEMEA